MHQISDACCRNGTLGTGDLNPPNEFFAIKGFAFPGAFDQKRHIDQYTLIRAEPASTRLTFTPPPDTTFAVTGRIHNVRFVLGLAIGAVHGFFPWDAVFTQTISHIERVLRGYNVGYSQIWGPDRF